MSTLTTPAQPGLDLAATRPIPFTRLVAIELRKMVDTRAGFWLLLSTGLATAGVLVIMLIVGAKTDSVLSFTDFMTGANMPLGVFLPILGIMAVTAEFSQRTALVSFVLVPSRLTLIGAKFVASVMVALLAVATGLLLAAGATFLMGVISDADPIWNQSTVQVTNFFLWHLIGMATGFAFGTLFLNTAVAIVMFFVYSYVLSVAFSIAEVFLKWWRDLRPWADFNFAQQPLVNDQALTSEQWQHLAVSGALWLLLPLAIGLWRVLRAEVK
ncbi:MAG: ABC transporter permease [Nocardioides sp.]